MIPSNSTPCYWRLVQWVDTPSSIFSKDRNPRRHRAAWLCGASLDLTRMEDLSETWVSVRLKIDLASITTVILLIFGTPLAWWLARSKSMWSEAVATIIVLPPMLPQPVLGFYLLALLGPTGPDGLLASLWGERTLAFTFAGLVIGSVLSALPVVVHPIRNAFATMGDRPLEVAATLRASPSYAFVTVAPPLARPAFLTAAMLGFAHDRRIRGRADD